MKRFPLVTTLAVALAVSCAAFAQTAPDAAAKELETAREELRRAARRVAELSREAGAHDAEVFENRIVERRMHGRPRIGVILDADDTAGVRIAAVTPNGAAAKAGLQAGDRLVAIDGRAITGKDADQRLASARERLRDLRENTPVALGYAREGRNATAKVTPQKGVADWTVIDGAAPRARLAMRRATDMAEMAAIGPEMHREIIRLERDGMCKDDDCRYPLLMEAVRWHGLNLASVDSQLGRYFGTDRGVLVLGFPRELGDLQPGDVVRKIDGKPVGTPRELMAAAHARDPGSEVSVEYLRDRKSATTKVKVPERRALRLPPAPPVPPAPPAPPAAPPAPPAGPAPAATSVPTALPAVPVPPAPPAPPAPPEPDDSLTLL